MLARNLVGASIAISVAITGPTNGQISRGDRYSGARWATRSPVIAQHGIVASEQPLASEAAVQVLRDGGSAVDAAIAANAMIGLMQPVLNGIGGDLFAIVYDPKTHHVYGYNGAGWSPKNRDLLSMTAQVEAAYKKAGMANRMHIPSVGPLSITVPGAVDAWFALHETFGKLPIARDLAPTIDLATNGFPVTELIADYWKSGMAKFEKDYKRGLVPEFDNARHTYRIGAADSSHTPEQGEIFANPDLAQTLTLIARDGRDVFYKGEIARTIDTYMKRIGGDLRYDDFAEFHGEWVKPESVNYRGYDVYELPPNGQGIAVLEMLQVLKHFDLNVMGIGTADTLTTLIEAKRLAYEDLAKWYADPSFYHAPTKGLLSEEYAERRLKEINLSHANPNIAPGDPRLYDGDTIYLTAADKDGMMVSLIQSNYHGMGSGMVADHLGFMFQDRGELFSLNPDDNNVYGPRKRPFHTIIPAFVMKDDQPFLSFGVMGGDMQAQAHVQILTNIIDFGLNIQEAGDAARWRHFGNSEPTGEPSTGIGTVQMESGFAPDVKAELQKRGYKIVPGTGSFGGYQAIMWDIKNHVYWGASEMRKDGAAIGY